jgi:myosin-light-chain kinase
MCTLFVFPRGKFGEVKQCKERRTGRQLAAKFIDVNGLQDKKDIENEVEIMKLLQHPRLLQLYDAFESKNTVCIVTEL